MKDLPDLNDMANLAVENLKRRVEALEAENRKLLGWLNDSAVDQQEALERVISLRTALEEIIDNAEPETGAFGFYKIQKIAKKALEQ